MVFIHLCVGSVPSTRVFDGALIVNMDIFLEALFNIIDPITLIYMVIGVGAGLMAGSIPGFTIAMAIVLTLPFTFSMPPAQGLATMISVLVGGLSGGLMSGILTGIPGTSIFSCDDL